jgi:hypothetical protein
MTWVCAPAGVAARARAVRIWSLLDAVFTVSSR